DAGRSARCAVPGPVQQATGRDSGRASHRIWIAGQGSSRRHAARAGRHPARQEGAARQGRMGHAPPHGARRAWTHRPITVGAPGCDASARMKKIVIVNGPNLNLLGKREPKVYGTRSLADLLKTVRAKAKELGVTVSAFQSNHEGEIIDFLQKEAPGALG